MSDTVWHCLDCKSSECSNPAHAWAQLALVELPDQTEAWLWEPASEETPGE